MRRRTPTTESSPMRFNAARSSPLIPDPQAEESGAACRSCSGCCSPTFRRGASLPEEPQDPCGRPVVHREGSQRKGLDRDHGAGVRGARSHGRFSKADGARVSRALRRVQSAFQIVRSTWPRLVALVGRDIEHGPIGILDDDRRLHGDPPAFRTNTQDGGIEGSPGYREGGACRGDKPARLLD